MEKIMIMKNTFNLGFVILIFMVLGCVCGGTPDKRENETKPTPKKGIMEIEEFQNKTSAEHLAEAKKLYSDKSSDTQLSLAAIHLTAIPETATEYKEAQTLLKQIQKKIDVKLKEREIDADALQVVSSRWRKGGFGLAGIWTVTFYNRSNKPIGDIQYQTRYYSETGNDLGGTGGIFTTGEIQKIIPPRKKRTIKINDGFIDREAATGTFKVTGWRFIQQ